MNTLKNQSDVMMGKILFCLSSVILCTSLAACGGGEGESSLEQAPQTPTPVADAPRQEKTIRISWDPEIDASVAGYRVYHGNTLEANSYYIDSGLSTTIDFRIRESGRHYFSVVAVDVLGGESAKAQAVYVDL